MITQTKLSNTRDYAKNRLFMLTKGRYSNDSLDQPEQIKKEIRDIVTKHLDISKDKYEIRIILKEDRKRD